MFNHARTLLLNASGAASPGPAFPGEEGVPHAYRPFRPPGYLAAVRAALFGRRPDRLMMNYRLAQYMTLLHATELAEHVLALDPRVTYVPGAEFPAAAFGVTAAGSAEPIYFGGRFRADEALGRLRAEWRVEAGAAAVAVARLTPPGGDAVYESAAAAGLFAEVPLDGPGFRAAVAARAGEVWHVTAAARPLAGLPEVVAAVARGVGDAALVALFGAAPAEPYRTFRALWHDHPAAGYRLGGVLAAAAYRSDEQWRREGGQ